MPPAEGMSSVSGGNSKGIPAQHPRNLSLISSPGCSPARDRFQTENVIISPPITSYSRKSFMIQCMEDGERRAGHSWCARASATPHEAANFLTQVTLTEPFSVGFLGLVIKTE